MHRQVFEIAGGGLTARLTDMGAALMDLRLDGHAASLVLGLADPAHYPAHSSHMGATAGRVANRIAHARITLDGTVHHLDANAGPHMLHGGAMGTGKCCWEAVRVGEDTITFALLLADGEMGFPGAMRLEARFSLLPGACLRIDYTAETDAPTLCNLAHHSYWNLDGQEDISHHVLTVAADRYLPVDDALIPRAIAPVDGTRFDFRAGRALPGEGLLDHNLCLSDARGPLRDVAWLRSAASGVAMTLATTEPGLQVYDGAKLAPRVPGLDGRRYGPHAGVALEPQIWPDALGRDGFPSPVLRPGETYHQTTTFTFSKG